MEYSTRDLLADMKMSRNKQNACDNQENETTHKCPCKESVSLFEDAQKKKACSCLDCACIK